MGYVQVAPCSLVLRYLRSQPTPIPDHVTSCRAAVETGLNRRIFWYGGPSVATLTSSLIHVTSRWV